MNLPFELPAETLRDLGARGLRLLLILVLAAVAQKVVRRGVRAGFRQMADAALETGRAARLRTLGGLVGSTAGYVVFFVALLMVLDTLGVDTKAVLTTAGILGLAVGLGAQRLVRDVIGGFFIIMENQFSDGETVTLGGVGVTGTVQEMGLRVTKLRDEVGRLVAIANGDITVVTNHSRGPLTVNVDLTLAGDADLTAVQAAVAGASAMLIADQWAQSPRMVGLLDAPEGKLRVRVAGQATPGQREPAEMALRAALRRAFTEQGIPL